MSIDLIFKHDDFLIVNKPEGINVHDEDENKGFLNLCREYFQDEKLQLVHRLDKLTSGLMIFSRNNDSLKIFNELFREHKVSKTYLALSNSKPNKKQGTIKGDLEKGRGGAFYLRRTHNNPSLTTFKTQSLNGRRVFILSPKTGKTHQLRVVMKSLGSSILGDTLYGGDDSDRMYLHAYKLAFPYKEELFSFTSYPKTGVEFLKLGLSENLE